MAVKLITIPYTPRPAFRSFHERTHRWACLVAHRRAGKTVAAINDILRRASTIKGQYAMIAPFRSQIKAVSWLYLKHYGHKLITSANESELFVELVNGSLIRLFGADNSDALRGLGFHGVYLDEYGDFRPSTWGSVIRPTLSDHQGWAVFSGTPKGHNQFYEVARLAEHAADWFYLRLPADTSGILPSTELAEARKQLSQDQYDQEYGCSFEAAIVGAFYGVEMRELTEAGRITDVPYDPAMPVHTAWDLGRTDDTAIWWYQVVRGEVHVLDHFSQSGCEIRDLAGEIIKRASYRYGKHYLPHDARAKTLASGGKSVIEQLGSYLGMGTLAIVPNIGVQDGIQAVRAMLPRTWFDRKCMDGTEALKQYQREFDEDTKAFRKTPLHDWTSHSADAARMMAVAEREEEKIAAPVRGKTIQEMSLNELWEYHETQNVRDNRI